MKGGDLDFRTASMFYENFARGSRKNDKTIAREPGSATLLYLVYGAAQRSVQLKPTRMRATTVALDSKLIFRSCYMGKSHKLLIWVSLGCIVFKKNI